MSHAKQETVRTADAIFDAIKGFKEPVTAGDIAKEFNLGKGRHTDISSALKLLRSRDQVIMTGTRRHAKYVTTEKHLAVKSDPVSQALEQATAPPVPKPPRARAVPVHMVEVPKTTLKLIIKAVMQCCTPMDNALQRATLQCMEKLI
jgi:hypothetical protein